MDRACREHGKEVGTRQQIWHMSIRRGEEGHPAWWLSAGDATHDTPSHNGPSQLRQNVPMHSKRAAAPAIWKL